MSCVAILPEVWTGWDFQVSARLEEAFAQLPLTGSLRTAMLLERGHSDVSWRTPCRQCATCRHLTLVVEQSHLV